MSAQMQAQTENSELVDDEAFLLESLCQRFELVHLRDEDQPLDAARLFDLEQGISEMLLAPVIEQLEELGLDDVVLLSAAHFLRDELDSYIAIVAEEVEATDEQRAERLEELRQRVADPQAASDPFLVEQMTEVIVRETLEAPDPADALALLAAQVESGRYLCRDQTHDARLCAVGKQLAWTTLSEGELQIDRGSELWARALYIVAEFGQPVLPALTLVQ